MALIRRVLLGLIVVLGFSAFQGYENAYGFMAVAKTHELFAVGQPAGTAESYLYTINPLTGALTMIGDTGLNYCNGIAFNPDGKLKAACETRSDTEASTKGLLAAGTPVIAELDTEIGEFAWVAPHGVSNFMSDITIRDDGSLFSYENLETDRVHRHTEPDFQAMFIGETGIEGEFHGMAFWGSEDIKVATNVDGSKLFVIDPITGQAMLKTELTLPEITMVALSGTNATRLIDPEEEIEFIAMDKVVFPIAGGVTTASTKNVPGDHAFAETEADFATVLVFHQEIKAELLANRVELPLEPGQSAIALIDVEGGLVDFIVPIQGDVIVMGLALRERDLAQVPTLSEWGLIATAILLFAGALYFLRRRGLSLQD